MDTATLSNNLKQDPELAWAWYCNLKMTCVDAGATHEQGEKMAQMFMRNAFNVIMDGKPPTATNRADKMEKEVHKDTDTSRQHRVTSILAHALNGVSAENASNTPDFILADHLYQSLLAFEKTTAARQRWYGVELTPAGQDRETIPGKVVCSTLPSES